MLRTECPPYQNNIQMQSGTKVSNIFCNGFSIKWK